MPNPTTKDTNRKNNDRKNEDVPTPRTQQKKTPEEVVEFNKMKKIYDQAMLHASKIDRNVSTLKEWAWAKKNPDLMTTFKDANAKAISNQNSSSSSSSWFSSSSSSSAFSSSSSPSSPNLLLPLP
eukprot:9390338-Pyramimonas_sp.AAC.1